MGEWSTAVEAVVATLGAIGLVLVWLGRLLWQLDRRQRDHDTRLRTLVDRIEELVTAVEHIDNCTDTVRTVVERELRPNGGDSIRDRVVRCETILERHYPDQ